MSIGKDMIMISSEELRRLGIVKRVLSEEINQQEASEVIGISDRQVRRIVKRVREEGERGIVHRLRGGIGSHRIEEEQKQKILGLYRREYEGFGPLLASEKLKERDKIKVCDETLRLWLIKEGLWEPRRQREIKKRSWRARKERYGQMQQMDGSHHDWLEGRGPKMVLMGYIDDARGRVYAKFYEYEGTQPAMDSLKGYIKKHGIPTSIYLDKHSTYKVNKKQTYREWPFRDEEELTQFGRACQQLGIELIYAGSPQAKGRVERLFETFQDRLVKELRLENAKTVEEANKCLKVYLPKFNKQFMVAAKKSGDLHRGAQGINLDEILSIQTEKPLRNDRTIVHDKQWYQVLAKTRARKVTVYEYVNGQVAIKHNKNRLEYKLIEGRLPRIPNIRKKRIRRYYQVPKNHIWRIGFKLRGSLTHKN
jgi:transposase